VKITTARGEKRAAHWQAAPEGAAGKQHK